MTPIANLPGPLVCVPLNFPTIDENIAAVRTFENDPDVDIFELRLDQLRAGNPVEAAKKIAGASEAPFIGTIRRQQDGGAFDGNEDRRVALLLELPDAGIRTIDFEYDLDRTILHSAVEQAHKKSCEVIISHHDFKQALEADEITEIALESAALGADLVKIVSRAETIDDVIKTAQAAIEIKEKLNKPFIVMNLGGPGRVSRALCPLLGSHVAFCAAKAGAESAPGQLTVKEYHQLSALLTGTN